jgi:hypothetical protein
MNTRARLTGSRRPRRLRLADDDINEPTEAAWDDDGADHEPPSWAEDMFPKDAA